MSHKMHYVNFWKAHWQSVERFQSIRLHARFVGSAVPGLGSIVITYSICGWARTEYHRMFGGKRMKARGWIATTVVGAAGVLAAGLLVHKSAQSADHLDSPATKADPTVDINDVFTWNDASNLVVAATLYPAAPTGTLFSTSAQYVLHTSSGAAYGQTNKGYDIICTFSGTTAPQTAKCWGGNNEYVTGDASGATGITSTDGKFKVFAGLRSDPFFFNLDGFNATIAAVEAAGAIPTNDAGCPLVPPATAAFLVNQLSHASDGGAPTDFFATLNALAIVVSIDKTLVTTGGPIVSVWASTHK